MNAPLYLYRLMEIPRRLNLRLKGEQELSYKVANMMRAASFCKLFNLIFFRTSGAPHTTPSFVQFPSLF